MTLVTAQLNARGMLDAQGKLLGEKYGDRYLILDGKVWAIRLATGKVYVADAEESETLVRYFRREHAAT